MKKINVMFSAGEGREFVGGCNWLMSDDRKIYAEVELPADATTENTEEDFGYLTMMEAIREKVPAEVLANYEFFYGPDFEFSADASADARVYVEYEED